MSLWNSIWASERFPGGSGLWRGGLWTSQHGVVEEISETEQIRQTLFGTGQQGVLYYPKPMVDGEQVLWQDVSETAAVTADGEVIGNADDLSPNDNDATQSTASLKPIYKTDGTLHWASHDGVDDRLRSETGLNADVDEFWLFFAGERGAGGGSVVFSLAETGGSFQYLRLDKTQIFVRAESSSTNQVTAAVTGTDTTAVWSIRARKSDRTVTVWRNRVQAAQVTAPGADWFPQPFYLYTSGGQDGASPAETVGRGYIWVLDALGSSAVSETEDYLADLAGVTL